MQVISLHPEHNLLLDLCGTEAPTNFLATVKPYESIPCGNGLHLQCHLPRSKETVQGWGKELYLQLGGWVLLSETSWGARFYNTLWLISHWGKLIHKGSELLAAECSQNCTIWLVSSQIVASQGKRGVCMKGLRFPLSQKRG